jgi:hypothetical protein
MGLLSAASCPSPIPWIPIQTNMHLKIYINLEHYQCHPYLYPHLWGHLSLEIIIPFKMAVGFPFLNWLQIDIVIFLWITQPKLTVEIFNVEFLLSYIFLPYLQTVFQWCRYTRPDTHTHTHTNILLLWC